jgi:hypothetical protein
MVKAQVELIIELKERSLRAKNIIISGMAEPKATNTNERQKEDKEAVRNIMSTISIESPEPEKIFRLGKYQPTKTRPIKVCYESQNTAINILRRRHDLTQENIKIYSDRTPQQQAFKKHLKEELERRIASGENNIEIKYVKGIPKIIKTSSKNPNHSVTTPLPKK